MTHLVIAGHGILANNRFDPGATGIISKGEHKYMKEDLFPVIRKYLPKDHNIVFFDQYSVVSRGNLVALVNQYGADQVTEFHYDAATAAATGGHVIIHADYEPDQVDLAYRDVIKDMVGVRYSHKGHQGISGRRDLGNVNRARNAGITYRLLELGFGTNKTDADIMVNQVDEYARKLAEVLTGTTIDKKESGKVDKKPSNPAPKPKPKVKTVAQMANEVEAGKHGDGHVNRRKSLGVSQSVYEQVRAEVNKRAGIGSTSGSSKPKPSKTIKQMANEIINGRGGQPAPTGHDKRRAWLGVSDKTYEQVRAEVNARLGSGTSKPSPKPKQDTQSIYNMATKIINDPKAPQGHEARRKWLGVNQSTYEKVRAEVNKRLS